MKRLEPVQIYGGELAAGAVGFLGAEFRFHVFRFFGQGAGWPGSGGDLDFKFSIFSNELGDVGCRSGVSLPGRDGPESEAWLTPARHVAFCDPNSQTGPTRQFSWEDNLSCLLTAE
ncbi:MAG: hypothetical protein JSS02_17120 [Planctomycetes bacterium]|nr:hypothetical protein [Planctomycetota bacterium]